MELRIAGRAVGDGHRPYVIAEMSANHGHSLDRALRIVDAAAESGADAIKLQTFTPRTLTLDSHRPEFFIPSDGNPWAGARLWDLYESAYLPWEWHAPIFERARAKGLGCISTAFDSASVAFLAELGVDALKIASFELVNLPLVEMAAKTGKPLILSTGMGTAGEIRDAVTAARATGNDAIALLKCTSAYPAEAHDANLLTIPELRRVHEVPVGISDHTMTVSTVAVAVALGACIVEKHLTLSRADGGPDAAFSLEPAEFAAMARVAREAREALGEVRFGPLASEQASLWERPSVFATRAIGKGETFTAENIRVIRPGAGLAPRLYPVLLGRRARVDIEEASPLGPEMVEGDLPDGGRS